MVLNAEIRDKGEYMSNYENFRQRLDAVLRTLDINQVQKFLIDEKQWDADALPADPERSMWMMIAGSSALRDLHERAGAWLVSHGYADDAQAVLRQGKKQTTGKGGGQQRPQAAKGGRSGHKPHITGPKKPDPPKRNQQS